MDLWEELIRTFGIPIKVAPSFIEKRIPIPAEVTDRETYLTWDFCKMVINGSTVFDLPLPSEELLEAHIYSPMQLLLYLCARRQHDKIEEDYPFCFSTVGYMLQLLESYARNPISAGNENSVVLPPLPPPRPDYRVLLQTIFQLRERTEERESLSLEVRLPLDRHDDRGSVPIGKLAQVFGRGIATTDDLRLLNLDDPNGCVSIVFPSHEGSPMSALYELKQPFGHIAKGQLHIILRRDGHVAICLTGNPLLEFYNGGWHVVDLLGGQGAVTSCLDKSFNSFDDQLSVYVTRLSYHMATHWHGGIVAVVDKDVLDDEQQVFEKPHSSIVALRKEIIEVMKRQTNECCGSQSLSLSKCLSHGVGLGRLLMSSAIQDGAILISPTSEFLDVGRIVKKPKSAEGEDTCDKLEGGARTYAACMLSRHGVALKISQDGSISLFASKEQDNGSFKITNLRIH